MARIVFVTVGTTKFDKLIKAVYEDKNLKLLKKRGFDKVIFQIGKGQFEPEEGFKCNLEIEVFRLKPSILEYFNNADLIISHAGAGSCIEALSAGKTLIAVVNNDLMDNHQLELAGELSLNKYCFYCDVESLLCTISSYDTSQLKKYQPGNPKLLADYLDTVMITI